MPCIHAVNRFIIMGINVGKLLQSRCLDVKILVWLYFSNGTDRRLCTNIKIQKRISE
jgi:hypothetical protein